MSEYQVAIIGGGLVGASLALALQAGAKARGWRIVLIEPFAPGDSFQPSYDARSSALSYGTRGIYESLGVWQALAQRAQPIRQIHVSDRGRFGGTRLIASQEHVPALGYVVENAWLGHCLWQALDRDTVHWRCPAQVTRAVAVPHGFCLQLDDGSELACDLAVLADGGRSDLREQMGIAVQRQPYDQVAVIANVTTSQAHEGQAFERFTSFGPLALLPLIDDRSALIWTHPLSDASRLRELDDRAFLEQLQVAFGYRLGTLTHVGQRQMYPLELVRAQEQVRPHMVVLGNAAHALHPIAGQGFNLSLRDVQALAQALFASDETPGAFAPLQAYARSQQLDQRLTTGFSDRITRLFGSTQPLLAGARDLGLLGMDMLPPARQWFARQAMGLGTRGESR